MKRSKRRFGGRDQAPGTRERSDMQTATSKKPEPAESGASVDFVATVAGKAYTQAEKEVEIRRKSAQEKIERLNKNVNEYLGGALRFRYQVAPRKRVPVELHGVKAELVSGAQVIPELVGGQEKLDGLVACGLVLKALEPHESRKAS